MAVADPLALARAAHQHRRGRLTLAASEGRGVGSVLIQWLIRNSGASSVPRFGTHVAGQFDGVVELGGRA